MYSGPSAIYNSFRAKTNNVARKFDQLMILGKVTAALDFFQQIPRAF